MSNEKTVYQAPQAEIVRFEATDVIFESKDNIVPWGDTI